MLKVDKVKTGFDLSVHDPRRVKRVREEASLPTFRKLLIGVGQSEDWTRLTEAINAVYDAAAEGNLQAVAFIADRLDGKAAASVEVKTQIVEPERPVLTRQQWLSAHLLRDVSRVIEHEESGLSSSDD